MIISAGNNQYRRATVRECASIQTFPITFQFAGNTIASRYKQAGNAVPPILTFQIAQEILKKEHIPVLDVPKFRTVAPFPVAETSPKRKQRKIDYSRPRSINFPGKELRGFRIELKSKYLNNTVAWETIFHQGEGKVNHSCFQTTLNEAIDFSTDNISHLGKNERDNFAKLLKIVRIQQIEKGSILHNEMHKNYGAIPNSIDKISFLLDEYFPKSKYGKTVVGIIEPLVGLSKSTLRIRLIVSIALAKILEEKLNNG
jgi:DNA (cytosine-5)-methyltransferase 1